MSFPELLLAGMVVAAGIVVLDQFSSAAAWLLTILILIIIAMRYPDFATELSKLLSVSSPPANQDPNFNPDTSPLNSIPIDSTGP